MACGQIHHAVNQVLQEHSQAHSFMNCLCLAQSSCKRPPRGPQSQSVYYLVLYQHSTLNPVQINAIHCSNSHSKLVCSSYRQRIILQGQELLHWFHDWKNTKSIPLCSICYSVITLRLFQQIFKNICGDIRQYCYSCPHLSTLQEEEPLKSNAFGKERYVMDWIDSIATQCCVGQKKYKIFCSEYR